MGKSHSKSMSIHSSRRLNLSVECVTTHDFEFCVRPLSVMMNGFSDSDISSRPRVSRRLTGARSGAFGISCFGIDFRVFVCLQRSYRQSFWNAPQIGPRPLPAGFLSVVPPVSPPFRRFLPSLWPTLRLRALVFWPLSFSISRVLFPQRWTPGLDQEHSFRFQLNVDTRAMFLSPLLRAAGAARSIWELPNR